MKIILGLVVCVFLALSVFADYKWKRWMAARKQERDGADGHGGRHD